MTDLTQLVKKNFAEVFICSAYFGVGILYAYGIPVEQWSEKVLHYSLFGSGITFLAIGAQHHNWKNGLIAATLAGVSMYAGMTLGYYLK